MKNSLPIIGLLIISGLLFSACKQDSVSTGGLPPAYTPGVGSTYTLSGTSVVNGVETKNGPNTSVLIAKNATRYGVAGMTLFADQAAIGASDTLGLKYLSNGDLVVFFLDTSVTYFLGQNGITHDTIDIGGGSLQITTTENSTNTVVVNGTSLETRRQTIIRTGTGSLAGSTSGSTLEYAPYIGYIVRTGNTFESATYKSNNEMHMTSFTLK